MARSITPDAACPMALGINVLSGRWKLRILWQLYSKGTMRFYELQRGLGDITTKTLTSQLRELEEQRVLQRTVYPEVPPRVEYSLTALGKGLEPVLSALCDWGKQWQQAASVPEK